MPRNGSSTTSTTCWSRFPAISAVAGLPARLGAATDAWLRDRIGRRRGATAFPFRLADRHVLIVPSAFGLGFGFMLFVTLLGALNFNNNMALLLVFSLGTAAMMTATLAHRGLVGLDIRGIRAEPVHAGAAAECTVIVANPAPRGRYAISLVGGDGRATTDLAPATTGTLPMRIRTRQRGWHPLPPFRLETRFPLGLFRAWCWAFPTERLLVWPAPAADAPSLPLAGSGRSGQVRRGEGDEFHGLRPYRPGDSLRRIAWKTSARHDGLFTRETETPSIDECVLAWDDLAGHGTEHRLSILTAWVLEAERRGVSWRLCLPGHDSGPGMGPAHAADGLRRLAEFPG